MTFKHWFKKWFLFPFGYKDAFIKSVYKKHPKDCDTVKRAIKIYRDCGNDIKKASRRDSGLVLRGLVEGLYSAETVGMWVEHNRDLNKPLNVYYEEMIVALAKFFPEKLEELASNYPGGIPQKPELHKLVLDSVKEGTRRLIEEYEMLLKKEKEEIEQKKLNAAKDDARKAFLKRTLAAEIFPADSDKMVGRISRRWQNSGEFVGIWMGDKDFNFVYMRKSDIARIKTRDDEIADPEYICLPMCKHVRMGHYDSAYCELMNSTISYGKKCPHGDRGYIVIEKEEN